MLLLAIILTVSIFATFAICACIVAGRADDTADQIARQIANGEAAQPATVDFTPEGSR